MTDPLTDAANAINSSSVNIRKFAQLAAARIEAVEARVTKLEGTPAPTPTGTRIGNGLLSNEQGNSFGTFTADEQKVFGGIISGSDKSAAFGQLHTTYPTLHGYIYHTVFEVGVTQASTVWPDAETEADAMAKGYIYRDSAGNPVKDRPGYSYICDPSIIGYQNVWAQNTKAQVDLGASGVFIDNCAPLAWWGTRPYKNGVAVTDSEIADALMSFLGVLKNAGLYVLANVGTWTPAHVAFCSRVCPVVGGVMIENYTGSLIQNQTIQAIQQAGRDPWVIAPVGVTGGSALARQYAQAFASVWDRKGGGFSVDAAEPANPNWTSVIAP